MQRTRRCLLRVSLGELLATAGSFPAFSPSIPGIAHMAVLPGIQVGTRCPGSWPPASLLVGLGAGHSTGLSFLSWYPPPSRGGEAGTSRHLSTPSRFPIIAKCPAKGSCCWHPLGCFPVLSAPVCVTQASTFSIETSYLCVSSMSHFSPWFLKDHCPVTSLANSSQDIGRYLSDLGVLDSFRVSSIFSYFQEDHFYERMGTKINKEKI